MLNFVCRSFFTGNGTGCYLALVRVERHLFLRKGLSVAEADAIRLKTLEIGRSGGMEGRSRLRTILKDFFGVSRRSAQISIQGIVAILIVVAWVIAVLGQAFKFATLPPELTRVSDIALGWVFGQGTERIRARRAQGHL